MIAVVIWAAAGVAVITAGITALWLINHEQGDRASGERSFPAPRLTVRRQVIVRWRLLRDRVPAQDWTAEFRRSYIAGFGSYTLPRFDDLEVHHPKSFPGRERPDMPAPAREHQNLPGPADLTAPQAPGPDRAGEPTPRQFAEVFTPRQLAQYAAATIDHTGIGAENDTMAYAPWFEELVGGDLWDGTGSSDAWIGRAFAGITRTVVTA